MRFSGQRCLLVVGSAADHYPAYNVFSKHGVPLHITSDQGTEFVSHFFHSLGKLLQMELHFISGYHPEGDRKTKHINQVLEQYLRAYTNYQQDDWSTLLLLAEF